MSMVVRNNLSAINTLNTLNRNHSALIKSLQTVATGMRINSAKDDASGYAISERMRVEIASLDQANRNTQNGMSMMKVAEGAVQSTVDILKTLKEKVINAANDTNTDADRMQIQKELNQSIDQINDNANLTYNGKYLVDGSKNGKSDGTFTALTNSSLYEKTTGASRLVALKDRNGQDLNIQAGDRVTVSYVQDGRTFTSSFTVTNTSSLATIMSKAENADNTSANPTQTFKPSDPSQVATLQAEYQAAYDAWAPLDGALSAFQSTSPTALSTMSNLMSVIGGDKNLGCSTTIAQGYNAWRNTSNPPDPTWVSSHASSCDSFNSIVNATTTMAGDYGTLQSNFTSYKNAYNALLTATGKSTYAEAIAAVDAAATAKNNAQAALEAANAPEIISGPDLGTGYSGTIVKTPDLGTALTITANTLGVEGQVAGFTISVTDTNGNIKKSVNAVLDAWTESIRGENASSEDNALVLQTGSRANQAIKIRLSDMRAQALGLQGKDGTTLNVSTQEKANAAINVLDNALQKALDQQTTIGSIESRLAYTSANLTTAIENLTASESTIRDADMAKAMTEYTKNNILMQASQAMLAQANQNNNQVLSLLR